MPLITLLKIDNFDRVRDIRPALVSDPAIVAVKGLDETTEIEPWIQSILHDTNRTPHGPSELVDILTHKMTVRGREGMGAFILKGRSFPTVRPKHVSHRIYRLERLADLSFAILAATGNILDEVKEQFISTATRLGCQYGFMDAHDLARLFVAFGYLCPRDGEQVTSMKTDYLIIDEFHHAAARSYRAAIEALSPSFLLGLTATPFRGDRQNVLHLCNDNIIVCYELREDIELGILCPYHYFGCFDNIDYSNIRHNGVRYDVRDLERADHSRT